ncbi:MAG: heme ABC exporter ATP-binding protein CcmA [Chloroflexi bacterium]|nr:heme ABC exporter ATP-binding protein CcmA [Chloroflexota bacterium]
MTETALITIRKLVKTFGALPVLRSIDLDMQRGDAVALLGANGSGKSTLLRLIGGLSKATSGEIRVGGWELPREAHAIRAQIGLVAHRTLVYDNLTARENLRFFGRLYNLTDVDAHIERGLARVGLARRADDVARTFSRGMQQRLAIARALLHDPAVLLLDEPYTGLDVSAAEVLDTIVLEARGEGRTILMTTHELDRAARLATRAIILAKGKVGFDGPMPEDLPAAYRQIVGTVSTG